MVARKVVVVSGSVGAGHDGVAHELARRLRELGHEVTVVDQLEGFTAWARFVMATGYLMLIRTAPVLYDLTCWVVERSRVVQWVADLVCSTSGPWLLRVTREADVIVAVYPPACRALGRLRAGGQLSTPVVGYLTDPAPNFRWVHPALDAHLTAAKHTAQEVTRRYGVTAEASGPLVDPRFRTVDRTSARDEVRASLGIAADEVVALLLLGSLGMGSVDRAARALSAADIRPVVLCARNERLRRRAGKIPGVTALGWRTDVDRLISAADVVVHNAGGLSLTESLVVGVPAVTYAAIPGHGKANARSLEASGTAPWARSPEQLVAHVARLGREQHHPWPVDQETSVAQILAHVAPTIERPTDLMDVRAVG